MTTLRQFPLEGTAGSAVTAANSGFDLVSSGGSSTDVYSTAAVFQGTTGAQFTATAADATFADANFAAPCSTGAASLAFTVPSSPPSADTNIGQLYDTTGARLLALTYRSNGAVVMSDKGTTYRALLAATDATAGAKFRVEVVVTNLSTTAGSFTTRAYNQSGAQVGSTINATTANLGTVQMAKLRVGVLTAGAYSVGIDAVQVADSRTTEIGPITATNNPPSANAGTDQSVTLGATVTLAGTATDADGTIASTTWSRTAYPAGAQPTLSSTTSLNPTFTPAAAGTYIFTLTATDNSGGIATSQVTVTVLPVGGSGSGYTGNPVALTLLTPGDQSTTDIWGQPIIDDLVTLQNAVNSLIDYLGA